MTEITEQIVFESGQALVCPQCAAPSNWAAQKLKIQTAYAETLYQMRRELLEAQHKLHVTAIRHHAMLNGVSDEIAYAYGEGETLGIKIVKLEDEIATMRQVIKAVFEWLYRHRKGMDASWDEQNISHLMDLLSDTYGMDAFFS